MLSMHVSAGQGNASRIPADQVLWGLRPGASSPASLLRQTQAPGNASSIAKGPQTDPAALPGPAETGPRIPLVGSPLLGRAM